jgi:accessory colonization factor AcfC
MKKEMNMLFKSIDESVDKITINNDIWRISEELIKTLNFRENKFDIRNENKKNIIKNSQRNLKQDMINCFLCLQKMNMKCLVI